MTTTPPSTPPFDVQKIRADFPLLQTGPVYLDNGATTQKPQSVIDAVKKYYESENANIHRGVYQLSRHATDLYDQARAAVRRFINAAEPQEIIFTKGTTESINLVAACFGRAFLNEGDEVIVSWMEHHSNIVPWQIACQIAGATLKVIPINDRGELILEEYEKLLSPRTRIVAVNHISNSLGTINDVATITALAHRFGAIVLIDVAQWVAHHPTDVQSIGCDFYAFSGHKMFAPTGTGVLYGRRELLEAMPPYQGGGDMIESVTFEKTTYADLPNKYEAGTPHIAGAAGLGAAVEYIESVGLANAEPHERRLLDYATEKLQSIPGLRLIGTARHKAAVLSFVMDHPPLSPYDLGIALDRRNIAVRTGHHCCQPALERLGVGATTRASLAMYNTTEDIDALADALNEIVKEAAAHPRPAAEQKSVPLDQVEWPPAAADSPAAAADELVEEFEFLGDWEQRDAYVLEMGDKLLPMPAGSKEECNRVHGCMSTVHLVGRKKPDTDDVFEFLADSDAPLVRGLVAILQRVYSGQSAEKILAFDAHDLLRRLGLDQHLSMGRRNGLDGMIRRIRALAAQLVAESAGA
jgi:cysteine desulfurase/selenocysteine lyase